MGNEFSWTVRDVEGYKYLGGGAFGVVYLVNYPLYARNYAVKLVALPNSETRQLAMREAETLKKVSEHPNVTKIYSAEVSSDGALMIWMEHCDLGDLEHYMRDNRMTIDDVISVMKQVCDAVNYIHSKGVIHRDIKPANILLSSALFPFMRPYVKLADFGIGNFAESISHFETIYFNTLCGTPYYVAPEVINRGQYHNSADIYSIGRVLQVLTERVRTTSRRKDALGSLAEEMLNVNPIRRPAVGYVKTQLVHI